MLPVLWTDAKGRASVRRIGKGLMAAESLPGKKYYLKIDLGVLT